jgi:hypothetical protein
MQKFRVWDKEKNQWWEQEFAPIELAVSHKFPSNAADFYTLVPFTGQVDEQEFEIYEGDILKWNDDFFIVRWDEIQSCWYGHAQYNNPTRGNLRAESFEMTTIYGSNYNQ